MANTNFHSSYTWINYSTDFSKDPVSQNKTPRCCDVLRKLKPTLESLGITLKDYHIFGEMSENVIRIERKLFNLDGKERDELIEKLNSQTHTHSFEKSSYGQGIIYRI